MPKTNPKVTVIIPNFNGEKYIASCIGSVAKINYKNFEVIVVDDASTDDSVKIIDFYVKKLSNFKLIKSGKNKGAAAAKNTGAINATSDILVFIDNDATVPQNILTELIKALTTKKDLDAVQGIIFDADDKDKIQQAGGVINPYTGWLFGYNQNEKYSKVLKQKGLRERVVVAVSGCLAIRKNAWEKVGGFDELEAVHSEDIDFSWRTWIGGFQTKLMPKTGIYHKSKPLSDREKMRATSEFIHFNLVKNAIRSMIKNYELKNLFIYLPILLVLNMGRVGLGFFQDKNAVVRGTLRAFAWNIRNLYSTLKERQKVQSMRKVSDKILLQKIFVRDNPLTIYKNYLKLLNKK